MGGQLAKNPFFELARLAEQYPDEPLFRVCEVLLPLIAETSPQMSSTQTFANVFADLTVPYRGRYPIKATMWLWPTDETDRELFEKNCSEVAAIQRQIGILRRINERILKPGLAPNFQPLIAYGECDDLEWLETQRALKEAIDRMQPALLAKQCVKRSRHRWLRWREDYIDPGVKLSLHVAFFSTPPSVERTVPSVCPLLKEAARSLDLVHPSLCTGIKKIQVEASLIAAVYCLGVLNSIGILCNLSAEHVRLRDVGDKPRPLVVYVVGEHRIPNDMRVFSTKTLRYEPVFDNWALASMDAQAPMEADLFQLVCSMIPPFTWGSNFTELITPFLGTTAIKTLQRIYGQCMGAPACKTPCRYGNRQPNQQWLWFSSQEYPFPTPDAFLTNHAPVHFSADHVFRNEPDARRQYENHGAVVYTRGADDATIIERAKEHLRHAYCRMMGSATTVAPPEPSRKPGYEARPAPRQAVYFEKPAAAPEPSRKPGYEARPAPTRVRKEEYEEHPAPTEYKPAYRERLENARRAHAQRQRGGRDYAWRQRDTYEPQRPQRRYERGGYY